jgi:hypothetical protein
VDILVTQSGLREIHSKLVGLGYMRPFDGAKNLRDTEFGVRIEFLIAGQFPGDGKPKAVKFPEPQTVAFEQGGIKYLALPTLVELKLASGMTSPERVKDLADVQELIKICRLPIDFTRELDPFVHDRYVELWRAVQGAGTRFLRLWNDPGITPGITTIDELIVAVGGSVELQAMRADGVVLDSARQGHARLVCTSQAVATKHGMHSEAEFFDLDAE